MVTKRKPKPPLEAYSEGVGRRKTAVARVRITSKGSGITVNDQDYITYFKREKLAHIVREPLETVHKDIKASVHVSGGGIYAQAEAVRHGIARALMAGEPDLRTKLRSQKLLTRDPRMKERRKFGLKKARRAPQWSKR
ncbi:MAG: small subunit ribosomal protein S9 [Parcubacteria group bacterium Gr01-1014_70]|nr:MAG: small subunit ribosomal protein S9 [Parcubacteria group bacterium Gr01-1014_70]